MNKKDTIIIGAGLSGLAAALTLARSGQDVVVIESNAEVGGRVQTAQAAEGVLIDQGFQVLLSSYPELKKFVDIKRLELKPFNSGALVFNGENLDLLANPIAHPETFAAGVFNKYSTFNDKALVLGLIAKSQLYRSDTQLGGTPTLRFLKEFGFSTRFIEHFWRPFLSGVFLDPELSLGSDYFMFLLRCFATGAVTLPSRGMQELPRQMAEQLPKGSVRLGCWVKRWDDKSVELKSGELLTAQNVICAFDERSQDSEQHHRAVTTYYFTSPNLSSLGWDKWLMLVPARFGLRINHLALISSVSATYGGANGLPLLSASALGALNVSPEEIAQEIETIAGKKALHLRWIATTQIPKALPVIYESGAGFAVRNGVTYCGDRFSSPSINGALRSGRMAAESLLAKAQADEVIVASR